jgi:hypothetical protein
MSLKWEDQLRCSYTALLTAIDTKNGLEGALRSRSTFLPRTIKTIWEYTDTAKRVSLMLDQLYRGDQQRFDSFCAALKACDQEHIVQTYLKPQSRPAVLRKPDVCDAVPSGDDRSAVETSGNVSRRSAGDHCLSQECHNKLARRWNDLVLGINSDSALLGSLRRKNVFTCIQMQKLKDIENETDRNEQILRYLEKSSHENFLEFCHSLDENSQSHISAWIKPTSSHDIGSCQQNVFRAENETGPAATQQFVPSAAVQHTPPSFVPGSEFLLFRAENETGPAATQQFVPSAAVQHTPPSFVPGSESFSLHADASLPGPAKLSREVSAQDVGNCVPYRGHGCSDRSSDALAASMDGLTVEQQEVRRQTDHTGDLKSCDSGVGLLGSSSY